MIFMFNQLSLIWLENVRFRKITKVICRLNFRILYSEKYHPTYDFHWSSKKDFELKSFLEILKILEIEPTFIIEFV